MLQGFPYVISISMGRLERDVLHDKTASSDFDEYLSQMSNDEYRVLIVDLWRGPFNAGLNPNHEKKSEEEERQLLVAFRKEEDAMNFKLRWC